MKHIKHWLIALAVVLLAGHAALAAERKPIAQVTSDDLLADTQISPASAGDSHVVLVWWIPVEFWKSTLARDDSVAEADKQAMYKAYEGVSVLAIAQADIDNVGRFSFYDKARVQQTMTINYTSADGQKHAIKPIVDIDPSLQQVLNAITPILSAAMGQMGQNMHFFVIPDKAQNINRLMDPYTKGQLDVSLLRKPNIPMTASIPTPLNSLFIPRKCPNGQPAHISWKFCPWTGQKLPD